MPTTILVVEDDETSRNMLVYLLRKAGYRVCTASDGREGVDRARGERPDLIIMDVQMPQVDGYQAARELEQDPELGRIPIVAVTAVAMAGDREKVLAEGFDAYITKPIVPEDFVAQIEHLLPAQQRLGHVSASSDAWQAATVVQLVTAPSRARGRILIVDDCADNLKLLGMILKPSGFTVAFASTGHEAMLSARSARPDLIISDVHMAEGSGYDLLHELRLDRSLSKIPVVLISSSLPYGTSDQRHLELGARDLIVRPIDADKLLARIIAILVEDGGA